MTNPDTPLMTDLAPSPHPTSGLGDAPVGKGLGLLSVTAIAMVASAMAIAAYHVALAPQLTRIAVVDLASVYRAKESAFEKALTKDGVTAREREDALSMATDFARRLPRALDELATECQCTVLATNAVASRRSETRDLTLALRAKVGL
jgi:hypothetical protein